MPSSPAIASRWSVANWRTVVSSCATRRRELRVGLRPQLHGDAAKGQMLTVPLAQFQDDALHGLLNGRREGVVNGTGGPLGGKQLSPGAAVRSHQFDAGALRRQRLPAAQSFQFRQWHGKLQGRHQRQSFAIEQPE